MADDSQPSFWGGLLAGLNNTANQLPTNGLFNLGMGLVSASKPFGNVGDSLMKANQETLQNKMGVQQLQTNALNQQLLRSKVPGMQAYFQGLQGLLNHQGGAPNQPQQQQPTAPDTSNYPGIALPPSGTSQAPQIQAPQQVNDQLGIDPGAALRLGTLGAVYGMPGAEALAKYPESLTNVQKAIQTQRQMASQGLRGKFEEVSGSQNADTLTKNTPEVLSHWQQNAPAFGFDPAKDLTPANARTVATFGYNNLASNSGLPVKALPSQMVQSSNALGGGYDTDPITNKTSQYKADEPLVKIIGPNGQPTMVPASQAVGKTPFNESIFGAGNISQDAKEMAYQFAKVNGGQLPPGMTFRGNAEKATMANYVAARMKADGDTAGAMTAQGQATKAVAPVLKDFTSGKTSQVLNGLNTSIQHMDALTPVVDALGNGNMTLLNKASNFYKQQTGNAAPTNFAALKEFVSGEVAKAVLPGGGGEAERQALAAPINAANSPAQLKGAIETYKTALAGKTEALRNQWNVGTGGTQGEFDRFLLPATKKALGISNNPNGHPADIQAILDKVNGK